MKRKNVIMRLKLDTKWTNRDVKDSNVLETTWDLLPGGILVIILDHELFLFFSFFLRASLLLPSVFTNLSDFDSNRIPQHLKTKNSPPYNEHISRAQTSNLL